MKSHKSFTKRQKKKKKTPSKGTDGMTIYQECIKFLMTTWLLITVPPVLFKTIRWLPYRSSVCIRYPDTRPKMSGTGSEITARINEWMDERPSYIYRTSACIELEALQCHAPSGLGVIIKMKGKCYIMPSQQTCSLMEVIMLDTKPTIDRGYQTPLYLSTLPNLELDKSILRKSMNWKISSHS